MQMWVSQTDVDVSLGQGAGAEVAMPLDSESWTSCQHHYVSVVLT